MDATTLNTIVGIVGIVVGVIGAIVGIVGWKSLNEATKISNKAAADNGATVQQAQIIHNGLDDYAVIRLSKETTQEELQKIIETVQLVSANELNELVDNKMVATTSRVKKLEKSFDEMPKIYVGKEEPKGVKDGDIWFKPE